MARQSVNDSATAEFNFLSCASASPIISKPRSMAIRFSLLLRNSSREHPPENAMTSSAASFISFSNLRVSGGIDQITVTVCNLRKIGIYNRFGLNQIDRAT